MNKRQAKHYALVLRCKARNERLFAEGHEEEARIYERRAGILEGTFDFQTPHGHELPDNWLELAEKEVPDLPTRP